MWPMIAEPGLRCAECKHVIQAGRLCLSELPEETPPGVSRADFANYCVGCPECWKRGRHACYVRHLESGGAVGRAPRSLPCARCGGRIAAGDRAGVQTRYDWRDPAEGAVYPARSSSSIIAATTAASASVLARGVPSGSFADLSDGLRNKFALAGLGGSRGVRTLAEAQAFYRDSVPYPIRNLGEDATRRFLDGKSASHIESVSNAPSRARESANILWEDRDLNRMRGAANMTAWEEFRTRGTNAFDAFAIVFRECLGTAATAAFFGALLESPIAAAENIIHYRKRRKSGEEAVKDAAAAIARRAGQSAVIGFGVTAAVSLAGAGPLIVTIAPVLMPVGFALYGYTAIARITRALDDGLPLNEVGVYFCSSRCNAAFAYDAGRSALMRWEASRRAA